MFEILRHAPDLKFHLGMINPALVPCSLRFSHAQWYYQTLYIEPSDNCEVGTKLRFFFWLRKVDIMFDHNCREYS